MTQPIYASSESKQVVEDGKEKVCEWIEETMWEDECVCEVGNEEEEEEEEGKKEEEEEGEEEEDNEWKYLMKFEQQCSCP